MKNKDLTAWLDSLPDSPQGATLAGRMAKLKHRIIWGDDCWIIRRNDGSFSEIENNTLIGLVDHPRTLIAGGTFALSAFLKRNGKWHWEADDAAGTVCAGECDSEWDAMRAAESSLGLPVFPFDRSGPRDRTKRLDGRLVWYRIPEGDPNEPTVLSLWNVAGS